LISSIIYSLWHFYCCLHYNQSYKTQSTILSHFYAKNYSLILHVIKFWWSFPIHDDHRKHSLLHQLHSLSVFYTPHVFDRRQRIASGDFIGLFFFFFLSADYLFGFSWPDRWYVIIHNIVFAITYFIAKFALFVYNSQYFFGFWILDFGLEPPYIWILCTDVNR
jgi:hypothetical protein